MKKESYFTHTLVHLPERLGKYSYELLKLFLPCPIALYFVATMVVSLHVQTMWRKSGMPSLNMTEFNIALQNEPSTNMAVAIWSVTLLETKMREYLNLSNVIQNLVHHITRKSSQKLIITHKASIMLLKRCARPTSWIEFATWSSKWKPLKW